MAGMHTTGGGRGCVGDGVIARGRSLATEVLLDLGLNGIETEVFPAILDLDIGKGKAFLQGTSHLWEQTRLAWSARIIFGRCGDVASPTEKTSTGRIFFFLHGECGIWPDHGRERRSAIAQLLFVYF